MGNESRSGFLVFADSLKSSMETPVIWFRSRQFKQLSQALFRILSQLQMFLFLFLFSDTIVTPNQKNYPWYHRQFRRVPTIDECYENDSVCYFEANQQFKRDKLVDCNVIKILRRRFEDCVLYEGPDCTTKCRPLREQYLEASANWFTKYGDLGAFGTVVTAYMKQKHRLVWERRHGPVGSGIKE